MVLITTKRAMLFLMLSLFRITFCSADSILYPSSLIQYGDNIDYERLELLEERLVVQFVAGYKYSLYGTYTIRNSGEAYQATLGILFYNIGGWPSLSEMGINFTVDGRQIQYTGSRYLQRFVMGETDVRIASEDMAVSTMWALINVFFPENSTVTIQVQYQTSYSSPDMHSTQLNYNRFFEQIGIPANIDYWKGSAEFSLEIINESLRIDSMEGRWIANIQFFHAADSDMNINTYEYLRGLQSLETDLMRIQRPTGNSVKIYFTEPFLNNYRRSFSISLGFLGDEWFSFKEWSSEGFTFAGSNITQRELAPYEFIFLTNNQLRVIRNAFFARHGFIFRSEELQDIFNTVRNIIPPNPDFTEDMLTEIDRVNIAIIQHLEALAGD